MGSCTGNGNDVSPPDPPPPAKNPQKSLRVTGRGLQRRETSKQQYQPPPPNFGEEIPTIWQNIKPKYENWAANDCTMGGRCRSRPLLRPEEGGSVALRDAAPSRLNCRTLLHMQTRMCMCGALCDLLCSLPRVPSVLPKPCPLQRSVGWTCSSPTGAQGTGEPLDSGLRERVGWGWGSGEGSTGGCRLGPCPSGYNPQGMGGPTEANATRMRRAGPWPTPHPSEHLLCHWVLFACERHLLALFQRSLTVFQFWG